MNLFNMYTNSLSINVLVHGRESPKKTLPHCWMAKNMINDGELVS